MFAPSLYLYLVTHMPVGCGHMAGAAGAGGQGGPHDISKWMLPQRGVNCHQAMLNNLDFDFGNENFDFHNDGVPPSPSPPYTVSPRPPRLWVLLCAQ